MLTKKLYRISLILILLALLSSCPEVKIENSELCSVAGTILAGMDCANTHNKVTREMTIRETIEWLEASEEVKDSSGKVIKPAKAAAICQSAIHFNNTKTALEQACKMLGSKCTFEMKQILKGIDTSVESISHPQKTLR